MTPPLCVVAIGGGTGLPVVLRGLNLLALERCRGLAPESIYGIVSMTDDGGSSGRLTRAFDVPALGDIRNCLLALADDSTLPLLREFLTYRFSHEESAELRGHSVGNLLLTALTRIRGGDFQQAVGDVSRMLGLRGRIMFPTLKAVALGARLVDGSVLIGETGIRERASSAKIDEVFLRTGDGDVVPGNREALEAISRADAVIIGPGSLYSSVIPPLLVPDVRDALLERSESSPIFYVCNAMTEPGETDGFDVADHLRALKQHTRVPVHYCIVTRESLDENLVRAYAREALLRECRPELESIRTALDTVWDDNVDLAPLLREISMRASRVANLTSERWERLPSVQVRVTNNSPLPDETQVLELPASEVAYVSDRGREKPVLRHNGVTLVRLILDTLALTRRSSFE